MRVKIWTLLYGLVLNDEIWNGLFLFSESLQWSLFDSCLGCHFGYLYRLITWVWIFYAGWSHQVQKDLQSWYKNLGVSGCCYNQVRWACVRAYKCVFRAEHVQMNICDWMLRRPKLNKNVYICCVREILCVFYVSLLLFHALLKPLFL